jgi:hypothetical protein
MPKITEERFKYIVKNIYPPAGISRGVDNFIKELINHPEIKSLFECEPTECKFCGSSNTVVEHHDADNSDRVYCKTCCCQSSCKEIVDNSEVDNGNSQGMLDGSIEAYEVIEYEQGDNGGMFDCPKCLTDCPHGQKTEYGNMIKVGSNMCRNCLPLNLKGCKHSQGYEIEGKSIKCAFEFNDKVGDL